MSVTTARAVTSPVADGGVDDGLADVLRQPSRRAILDEMTRQAIEDGLYEDSAADYTEALREARRAGATG